MERIKIIKIKEKNLKIKKRKYMDKNHVVSFKSNRPKFKKVNLK